MAEQLTLDQLSQALVLAYTQIGNKSRISEYEKVDELLSGIDEKTKGELAETFRSQYAIGHKTHSLNGLAFHIAPWITGS